MAEFIEYILRQLVDHPEDIVLHHREESGAHFFQAYLHPDDVGRVVGKQGHTIAAIRNLLNAAATRDGLAVVELRVDKLQLPA